MTLEETWTYQMIYRKGEACGAQEECRRAIVRLGSQRFGTPSAEQLQQLTATDDLERLERIHDRLLTATDWDDLLATA